MTDRQRKKRAMNQKAMSLRMRSRNLISRMILRMIFFQSLFEDHKTTGPFTILSCKHHNGDSPSANLHHPNPYRLLSSNCHHRESFSQNQDRYPLIGFTLSVSCIPVIELLLPRSESFLWLVSCFSATGNWDGCDRSKRWKGVVKYIVCYWTEIYCYLGHIFLHRDRFAKSHNHPSNLHLDKHEPNFLFVVMSLEAWEIDAGMSPNKLDRRATTAEHILAR